MADDKVQSDPEPEVSANAWFNANRPVDTSENIQESFCGFGNNDESETNWEQVVERAKKKQQQKWDALPKVKKGFYTVHPEVANSNERDIASHHENLSIKDQTGKHNDLPRPVHKFEHCWEKYPDILQSCQRADFTKPTPIQCGLWPVLLSGYDAVGVAQTGSGKTLAFLLPAMVHLHEQDGRAPTSPSSSTAPTPVQTPRAPQVLVLTPTRELALQIHREVSKYAYKDTTSVCIYGGGDRNAQMYKCKQGVDIVIATPGRLNDLVDEGVVLLECFTYVVLDEADRMLDMGFEPQIKSILASTRPDRHTVMTSATWPPAVRSLALKYMREPIVHVVVGSLDLTACSDVQQIVEVIDDSESARFERVMFYINYMRPNDKMLIFVAKKSSVESLARRIRDQCTGSLCVETIHGDRMQYERENALGAFKSSRARILVATDVASRGLDVCDISIVLNVDMAKSVDEYVHRIGRTARAGRTGMAVTLFTKYDWAKAPPLCAILDKSKQEVPTKLRSMAVRYEQKMKETAASGGPGARGNFRPKRQNGIEPRFGSNFVPDRFAGGF